MVTAMMLYCSSYLVFTYKTKLKLDKEVGGGVLHE